MSTLNSEYPSNNKHPFDGPSFIRLVDYFRHTIEFYSKETNHDDTFVTINKKILAQISQSNIMYKVTIRDRNNYECRDIYVSGNISIIDDKIHTYLKPTEVLLSVDICPNVLQIE